MKTHARSALDVGVSCFADYRTPDRPQVVSLLQWLQSEKYAAAIDRIRRTTSRRRRAWLKSRLPAITPSGRFAYRHAEGLLRHSGFVQIDIDGQDNPHRPALAAAGSWLRRLPYLAYLGRSASGRGWWGLVRIAHPERHSEHVRALITDFKALGIILDEKPVNVSSLRGYSYDPDAYFNHRPIPYTKVEEWPLAAAATRPPIDLPEETRRVVHYLQQIEAQALDLTASYDKWFALACVFANTFGESGREYFHRLSRFYPHYDPRETDYHFNSAARGRYNYSLGTFYYLCNQAGLSRYEPRRIGKLWRRARAALRARRPKPYALQLKLPFA